MTGLIWPNAAWGRLGGGGRAGWWSTGVREGGVRIRGSPWPCATRVWFFAWDRFTARWLVEEGRLLPAARGADRGVAVTLRAQRGMSAWAKASATPCPRGARTSWTAPGGAGVARGGRSKGPARTFTFKPCLCAPRGGGPVSGDPVDRRQGAVQHHERLRRGCSRGLRKGRCHRPPKPTASWA